MNMRLPATALGLMSGTSLDGIDVAMLVTDGETRIEPGPSATYSYPSDLRQSLRSVLGGKGPVAAVEHAVTLAHGQAVKRFLAEHRISPSKIDVIGFHGHTIVHRPHERWTWQIGNGALLASETGIPVVNDFRSADMAAGGEGAPLVPLFHAALAAGLEKPLVVLNLGGVANATWIGPGASGPDGVGEDGTVIAFDTGPASAPIDDWMLRHTGHAMDENGALASTGQIDEGIVMELLSHPYFARRPPKSLDRDDFPWRMVESLSAADGAATLTALLATSVAMGARHFPIQPKRWLVTGGGRHNQAIMTALQAALDVPVVPVETVGWQGDALEAQAFAWLALRSRLSLPLSLPSTTGVRRPVTGGRYHPALAR